MQNHPPLLHLGVKIFRKKDFWWSQGGELSSKGLTGVIIDDNFLWLILGGMGRGEKLSPIVMGWVIMGETYLGVIIGWWAGVKTNFLPHSRGGWTLGGVILHHWLWQL